MTMLRDPVKRWISHWRYVTQVFAENPPAAWPERVLPRDFMEMSAREFVIWMMAQPPYAMVGWENYQTNFLVECEWIVRRFQANSAMQGDFLNVLQHYAPGWDIPLMPIDRLMQVTSTEGAAPDMSWITATDPVGRQLLAALADDQQLYEYSSAWLDAELATISG